MYCQKKKVNNVCEGKMIISLCTYIPEVLFEAALVGHCGIDVVLPKEVLHLEGL